MKMTDVNPRTLPIALGLGGCGIIIMAVYGLFFGQDVDSAVLGVLVVIGLFIVVLGGALYCWERDRYYKDRLEVHL
jgi:hypothetical protein